MPNDGVSSSAGAMASSPGQVGTLREDGQLSLSRRVLNGDPSPVLVLAPVSPQPARHTIEQLEHEYSLRDQLGMTWAARPLALVRNDGRTHLVLRDPGGELLSQLIGEPWQPGPFLHVAIGLAVSLGRVHERSLIHKDINPANILTNVSTGEVWLTGFGMASRLPRERSTADPPQVIAGTLAYMAPEQTGRMNRSVDSRSDLYSLGVVLYQMLTGDLPFTAQDPMGWVHCHVASQAPNAHERNPFVPEQLAVIVAKLLTKPAERRYQTAAGLETDLRRCLSELEATNRIAVFPLGTADIPDCLLIPEKLYGRERDVETLLQTFDRVVHRGEIEVVLVSGYSGIGKSSVVNELHKALVPSRGLFACGKFDQYRRDIPYATMAQALASLVRMILVQPEAELHRWRAAVLHALGPNGRLLTDLIPELELIIDPQPPVPDLPPGDALNRFQSVFLAFIAVFARPEHPLAIFLDDLQWLDTATIKLLEALATTRDPLPLLLIGAYRSNEVHATHPLTMTLEAIRRAGVRVHDIVLAALDEAHVAQMVADALYADRARADVLARLICTKTGGNPFFTIEFMAELVHERLLVPKPGSAGWTWDTERISAKGYTDNVVDLMAAKLTRLEPDTRTALAHLACLGNTASSSLLALVAGTSQASIEAALWDPLRTGVVLRADDAYAFVHDRVQEAAYSLLPEPARSHTHLRIGRLLLSALADDARGEDVFAVVSQLNRAIDLIDDPGEREALRRLNVLAGKKARASVAYHAARLYLIQAVSLSPPAAWECSYAATFDLYLALSECEYLVGHFARADELFDEMLAKAESDFDRATVYSVRMRVYQVAGKYDDGVGIALDALALFGVAFPASDADVASALDAEFKQIDAHLEGRRIADLADAPVARDRVAQTIINLLVDAVPCAYIGRPRLFPLIAITAVNYSIRHGNTEQSSFAYAVYAVMVVSVLGDIPSAFEFSRMAMRLNDKFDNRRLHGTILHLHADHVLFWRRPFSEGQPILEQAFLACQEVGDIVYAGFLAFETPWQSVEMGRSLGDVLAQSARYADFALKSNNRPIYETIRLEQQFARSLQGKTADRLGMQDRTFDEAACVATIAQATFGCGVVFYHIMKQILAFIHGEYREALAAATRAEELLGAAMSMPIEATYHFIHALTLAALHDGASPDQKASYTRLLAEKQKKLALWARNCPQNYDNRLFLVSAEIARLEGRDLEAMQLYERAVQSSSDQGFVHNEALALELAARFYETRGLDRAARTFYRDARHRYERWGADAKVEQLERHHPYLREEPPEPRLAATLGAPAEHLATVVKISQAVSGEIVLDRLIERLMIIAAEHAGAARCLLILPSRADHQIAAEAVSRPDGVSVRLCEAPVTPDVLPQSVLRYVIRTHETVILDDASAPSQFSSDPYVVGVQARSVLALPLIKQGKLLGVLYLENNLTPYVFSQSRIALLELLASQAAISLENAKVYGDIQRSLDERDALLREKEALLKEVHHRVKNNLQLISSLLSLQASRVDDRAIADLFAESRNRVRSMALVHENLYRAGNFAAIGMGGHIQNLCAHLVRAYGLENGRVSLATEVEDVEFDLDLAVSLGLIVNELVSNSLKHGYPDGRAGVVSVELRALGEARHQLVVRDDGVGMPPPRSGTARDSLGLQLVNDLTEQLHGTMTVDSRAGTVVSICFRTAGGAETDT
jgi:predicted ATPase/two-component sensor histidine kinase